MREDLQHVTAACLSGSSENISIQEEANESRREHGCRSDEVYEDRSCGAESSVVRESVMLGGNPNKDSFEETETRLLEEALRASVLEGQQKAETLRQEASRFSTTPRMART